MDTLTVITYQITTVPVIAVKEPKPMGYILPWEIMKYDARYFNCHVAYAVCLVKHRLFVLLLYLLTLARYHHKLPGTFYSATRNRYHQR